MAAAGSLRPPLRAATFRTIIGLLACTGLRIGEALHLDRDDVDVIGGVLTVRDSKFGKSREVLLHPTTVMALEGYCEIRDRLCPHPPQRSFFITTRGTRIAHPTIYLPFRALLEQAGITHPMPGRHVRVHDLRHSFAVRTLLGWYRDGGDVQARMPLLRTYLGHVDPAATFWYLSAAPELLGLAADTARDTRRGVGDDRARTGARGVLHPLVDQRDVSPHTIAAYRECAARRPVVSPAQPG